MGIKKYCISSLTALIKNSQQTETDWIENASYSNSQQAIKLNLKY